MTLSFLSNSDVFSSDVDSSGLSLTLSFLSNSDVFSNRDTEIQRTKREKGTEVPDNGEKNLEGKKGWNKILLFFLELCYSNIILKLKLYCSTIIKNFGIVRFIIL